MNRKITLRGAEILAETVIGEGKQSQAKGMVLSTLPKEKPTPRATASKFTPPSFEFDRARTMAWEKDGQCEAAYGPVSAMRRFTRKLQLVKLLDGKRFLVLFINDFGNGEMHSKSNLRRGMFQNEADAREFYRKTLARVQSVTTVAPPAPANPAIAKLREMARMFPANRQRYAAKIAEIEAESRKQAELKCTGETLNRADADAAHRQAVAQLARELFPDAHAVKPGPHFQKEFAKAMNRDCSRLGIDAAFATGELAHAEILTLARAIKAKSPHKPAQAEAVLNWLAAKYCDKPESQWTAAVAEKVKGSGAKPVKSGGLARTIRSKFKLKSTLTGCPETR